MSPLAEFAHMAHRSRRIVPPAGIRGWRDYLQFCWLRRCFVCGVTGKCKHREPRAESLRAFRDSRESVA